jgi:hypothetical protein
VWRWLSADPREVVDLAGPGTLAAGATDRHLGDELRRWRGIVARRRLVALARRHAAVALGLAALLEVLALLGAFPQWVVVAVPLAYFLVAVVVFAVQGPTPFGLARLLDDKLGLNDRLATALEIEARGGQETPLERRTVADAAGLLAAGREDWHASPARAGRYDWSVLGGVVLALAVVVAIGLATGGTSSSSPSALGPNGNGGAPGGPGEHHRAKSEKAREKHLAPTGKLHKLKGKNVPPSEQQSTKAGGYQRIPQGEKSNGKETKGPGTKAGGKGGGKAPTGELHKSDRSTPGQEKHGEEKTPPGTDANTETKEHKNPKKQTIGFNLKGQKHGGNEGKGPSHISGGAGNKPRSGAGEGKTGGAQAGTAEGAKGAQSTGGQKAGGEQGTNRRSQAKPITGQASQSVKIQPGYAPSRAKTGGTQKRKTGTSQGAGGKARTAQVTGATQLGEEFSYVPAAGGAVIGSSTGLQQNYLESLKWVERLPWS